MIRCIYIGLLLLHTVWAGDLYVFAPTFAKSNLIEKELSSRIKSATPHAFGRFSDFKAMVASQKPAAILAPMATVRALGFVDKVRLTGLVNGQPTEPMVLVSLDKALPLDDLSQQTIGLVAILDRPGLKNILDAELKSKPKANPATKLEDLLPMLTFQSATGIFVTANQAKQFKARSQANLMIQTVPGAQQECLVLVILSGDAQGLIAEMEKLPKPVLDLLDVEGWKR